jgi:hypothetical protein
MERPSNFTVKRPINKPSRAEIMITIKLLERSVMNYIYESIYVPDSKDADLLKKLNTVKDVQLSLEDFEIPAYCFFSS